MTHLLVFHTGQDTGNPLPGMLDNMGCRVWLADTPEGVRKILEQYPISLIVFTETTCAKEINTATFPALQQIPVLVCTETISAKPGGTIPEASELTDYLAPPFTQEKLRKKIDFLITIHNLAVALQHSQHEVDSLHVKIHDLNKSVEGHNSFLDLMSRRDGLTGLFNRRHFNTVLEECYAHCTERQEDLSLLVLNIDYFNEINRTCGQDFGDSVLNQLSARITSGILETDISFRLSGEDFAVLMPSAPEETALLQGEHLRRACEEKAFEKGTMSRHATVSIGVASLRSHRPKSHEELINMANQALFMAKSEGRNRCMSYSPIDRSCSGTTEQNFTILRDNVTRILQKTKTSTINSLQLLAQGIVDEPEREKTRQARNYVQLLSEKMLFPSHLIETFQNAFTLLGSIRYLLHNEMINKKGKLSPNEWEVLADLPYKLAEITELFDYFSGERTLLLYHGERYDGTGYPEGLKGDEIPIGARILSLVSAFAAMNSDRPYRAKLTPDKILTELTHNAGRQFDPLLVLKLFDIIEEKGILEVSGEDLENARKVVQEYI